MSKYIEEYDGQNLVFKSKANLVIFHEILNLKERGLVESFDVGPLLNKSRSTYSKYNARKMIINGITFDSILESKYYLHLLDEKDKGNIKDFDLNPTFQLLDNIKVGNRTLRGVRYIADFTIYDNDGGVTYVDVKGNRTPEFIIKEKMFHHFYEDKELKVITYRKRDGGWIELHEYERLRNQRRRERNRRRRERKKKEKQNKK